MRRHCAVGVLGAPADAQKFSQDLLVFFEGAAIDVENKVVKAPNGTRWAASRDEIAIATSPDLRATAIPSCKYCGDTATRTKLLRKRANALAARTLTPTRAAVRRELQ